ncbi:MAG TPA: Asp-tRNA(Asn)/Glu-tRNA(Gln) amidotransferase subunit GatA [Gammaproteobacteria bacterium]|nr:Asp-tRNA(Asn)/Glu-tRNA(Gln) amidotransferase subunit GatA [Gammaproteobacteria bacterium]
MHNKSITELSAELHNKEISSVELTKFFLERIKKFDGKLNSLVTVTEEQALAAAASADQIIAKGTPGPLTGIPILHKDIFCTEGVKTSCGSRMLDNFVAPYDATVVTKLKQAGTVMLGKTNMDEFAMGSSNEHSYYGAVKNPWHTDHVPGGSSGGSAAAIAARLAVAASGTDTGGSIRQPAALSGITGIKPTYGLVSRFGMIAYASSLDQGGPMAASAADCALMLQAMAGFDSKDSTSSKTEVPHYKEHLNYSVKGLKIGLPREFFSSDLSPSISDAVHEAVRELEKLGATIKDVSLPNTHLSIPAYYIIAPAEASSNLARYDGIRFGYRCKDPKDLADFYCRNRSEGFGAEVRRRIMIGTYVLSAGYYDAFYVKAQKIRRLIANDFSNALKEVDVLMGPTTPDVAFKIGANNADPVSMYLNDIYTVSINLAGLPALSMPCGFVNDLPVGVQIIGNYFQEAKLLNVAHQYQKVTEWHMQMPPAFA